MLSKTQNLRIAKHLFTHTFCLQQLYFSSSFYVIQSAVVKMLASTNNSFTILGLEAPAVQFVSFDIALMNKYSPE